MCSQCRWGRGGRRRTVLAHVSGGVVNEVRYTSIMGNSHIPFPWHRCVTSRWNSALLKSVLSLQMRLFFLHSQTIHSYKKRSLKLSWRKWENIGKTKHKQAGRLTLSLKADKERLVKDTDWWITEYTERNYIILSKIGIDFSNEKITENNWTCIKICAFLQAQFRILKVEKNAAQLAYTSRENENTKTEKDMCVEVR